MKLPIKAGEFCGFPSILDADGVTIASCVNPDALPRIVAAAAILHELAHMDPEEDNVKALAWLIEQARSALGEGEPEPERGPWLRMMKYSPATCLHEIPDREFDFGGDFDAVTKAAGYSETARFVLNVKCAWEWTVAEFCEAMQEEMDGGDAR